MQILLPMGGLGSRFSAAGFKHPKPFIEFHGKTMIENVAQNLGYDNHFTFVTQRVHYMEYAHVFNNISDKVLGMNVYLLDGLTNGAAESCLLAKGCLDPELPLMIANSDQMLHVDMLEFRSWFLLETDYDGVIMTFDSQDPKNSFARVDSGGFVVETAEKQVISPHATNGIYCWRKSGDFFRAAHELIDKNLRTNNEFYVAPVFNLNIAWGQKIGIYPIEGHHPIGTPEDLVKYLDYCSRTGNGPF
jgi:NDP-sugar pyrophosphorylase family protein